MEVGRLIVVLLIQTECVRTEIILSISTVNVISGVTCDDILLYLLEKSELWVAEILIM